MAIKNITPYLNFNGDAQQAIELYQRALGAQVEHIMRFGDGQGADVPPEHRQRVMHAPLRIGGGMLMISDTMPNDPVPTESNVQVVLDFDEANEMAQKFDALAAGGKVRLPLQDMFWGARFGMLTDAFGIQWMFNCELKKS